MALSIFERIRENRKYLIQFRRYGRWLKARATRLHIAIRKRDIELRIRKLMISRLEGMMEVRNPADTELFLRKSKAWFQSTLSFF